MQDDCRMDELFWISRGQVMPGRPGRGPPPGTFFNRPRDAWAQPASNPQGQLRPPDPPLPPHGPQPQNQVGVDESILSPSISNQYYAPPVQTGWRAVRMGESFQSVPIFRDSQGREVEVQRVGEAESWRCPSSHDPPSGQTGPERERWPLRAESQLSYAHQPFSVQHPQVRMEGGRGWTQNRLEAQSRGGWESEHWAEGGQEREGGHQTHLPSGGSVHSLQQQQMSFGGQPHQGELGRGRGRLPAQSQSLPQQPPFFRPFTGPRRKEPRGVGRGNGRVGNQGSNFVQPALSQPQMRLPMASEPGRSRQREEGGGWRGDSDAPALRPWEGEQNPPPPRQAGRGPQAPPPLSGRQAKGVGKGAGRGLRAKPPSQSHTSPLLIPGSRNFHLLPRSLPPSRDASAVREQGVGEGEISQGKGSAGSQPRAPRGPRKKGGERRKKGGSAKPPPPPQPPSQVPTLAIPVKPPLGNNLHADFPEKAANLPFSEELFKRFNGNAGLIGQRYEDGRDGWIWARWPSEGTKTRRIGGKWMYQMVPEERVEKAAPHVMFHLGIQQSELEEMNGRGGFLLFCRPAEEVTYSLPYADTKAQDSLHLMRVSPDQLLESGQFFLMRGFSRIGKEGWTFCEVALPQLSGQWHHYGFPAIIEQGRELEGEFETREEEGRRLGRIAEHSLPFASSRFRFKFVYEVPHGEDATRSVGVHGFGLPLRGWPTHTPLRGRRRKSKPLPVRLGKGDVAWVLNARQWAGPVPEEYKEGVDWNPADIFFDVARFTLWNPDQVRFASFLPRQGNTGPGPGILSAFKESSEQRAWLYQRLCMVLADHKEGVARMALPRWKIPAQFKWECHHGMDSLRVQLEKKEDLDSLQNSFEVLVRFEIMPGPRVVGRVRDCKWVGEEEEGVEMEEGEGEEGGALEVGSEQKEETRPHGSVLLQLEPEDVLTLAKALRSSRRKQTLPSSGSATLIPYFGGQSTHYRFHAKQLLDILAKDSPQSRVVRKVLGCVNPGDSNKRGSKKAKSSAFPAFSRSPKVLGFQLTEQQLTVMEAIMKADDTDEGRLIQVDGSAGTAKTATVVLGLFPRFALKPTSRVLVVSPTNFASDAAFSHFVKLRRKFEACCSSSDKNVVTALEAGRPLRICALSRQQDVGERWEEPPLHQQTTHLRCWWSGSKRDFEAFEQDVVKQSCSGIQLSEKERANLKVCFEAFEAEADKLAEVEIANARLDALRTRPEGAPTVADEDPSFALAKLKVELRQIRTEIRSAVFRFIEPGVIFLTLEFAKGHLLRDLGFDPDILIIDEASMITNESIIWSIAQCRESLESLVVVGDEMQLGPWCNVRGKASVPLSVSILSSLSNFVPEWRRVKPLSLSVSFRQTEDLVSLSNCFYRWRGEEPRQAHRKSKDEPTPAPILSHLPLLSQTQRALFVDIPTTVETPEGTSFVNDEEVEVVRWLLALMMRTGGDTSDVLVLSHYKNQVARLKVMGKELGSECVCELSTVDRVIGQECGVSILSFVRSQPGSDKPDAGFLSDVRRLNVATTRCKEALIMVGNLEHIVVSLIRRKKEKGRKPWEVDEACVALEFFQSLCQSGCVVRGMDAVLEARPNSIVTAKAGDTAESGSGLLQRDLDSSLRLPDGCEVRSWQWADPWEKVTFFPGNKRPSEREEDEQSLGSQDWVEEDEVEEPGPSHRQGPPPKKRLQCEKPTGAP